MNHQPFETWLLEDQQLSIEQKRELDTHLRTCLHCTALADTGLALRTPRMAAPAPGFTARFQKRLEAQRLAERRKRVWGVILFILAGLGVFAWVGAPLLYRIFDSPTQLLSLVVSYILFLAVSIEAVVEVGFVLLQVAPGFIPSYFWMILASGIAGFALLSTVSIWRAIRVPRGV